MLSSSDEYKRRMQATFALPHIKQNVSIKNTRDMVMDTIKDDIKAICLYQTVVRDSGYGILGENIHKGLLKHGYTVHNSYDGPRGFANKGIPSVKISVILSIPASYFKTSSRYSIGFTMFEATKIPCSWTERCNIMDRIIVPCVSNVEIFQRCGVTVPIDIVPIGIDANIYSPEAFNDYYNKKGKKFSINRRFDFGSYMLNSDNAYRFLVINDGQSRKNNEMIISAFEEEFEEEIDRYDVFLVIRSQRRYTGKGVIWINIFLYDDEMPLLIGSCDCMVSASSGEAGDIPILQGMAMEKPVIVTPGFVHDDYIIDTGYKKNGFFIESDGWIKAFQHPQYNGVSYLIGINDGLDVATWVMPNFDDLKKKMRYVYENRDEAINVGKNARLQHRTIDVMIDRMADVFDKL